jgi:hypothetical protein
MPKMTDELTEIQRAFRESADAGIKEVWAEE